MWRGVDSVGHLLLCILSGKSYNRQYLARRLCFKTIMIINIGERIREIVKQRGKSITWLAQQINCSRVNIYKIFERTSIDTNTLLRISDALDYDFFAIYSQNLTMNKKQEGEEWDAFPFLWRCVTGVYNSLIYKPIIYTSSYRFHYKIYCFAIIDCWFLKIYMLMSCA